MGNWWDEQPKPTGSLASLQPTVQPPSVPAFDSGPIIPTRLNRSELAGVPQPAKPFLDGAGLVCQRQRNRQKPASRLVHGKP